MISSDNVVTFVHYIETIMTWQFQSTVNIPVQSTVLSSSKSRLQPLQWFVHSQKSDSITWSTILLSQLIYSVKCLTHKVSDCEQFLSYLAFEGYSFRITRLSGSSWEHCDPLEAMWPALAGHVLTCGCQPFPHFCWVNMQTIEKVQANGGSQFTIVGSPLQWIPVEVEVWEDSWRSFHKYLCTHQHTLSSVNIYNYYSVKWANS